MKAANKSSIRTAGSSKRKGTVKRKASSRLSAKPQAKQHANPSANVRRAKSGTAARSPGSKLRRTIPAILLEGDAPGTRSPHNPTVVATSAPQRTDAGQSIEALPEAYGTQRLKLTPRDPHWIHAHWDFTPQQLRDANARSADGHLVLRMFKHSPKGSLVSETHVHPESVRWMVHVPQSRVRYTAELGFYDKRRTWSALAESIAVHTPASGASTQYDFELATLTPGGTVQRHGADEAMASNPPLPNTASALGGQLSSAGLDAGGSLDLASITSDAISVSPSSFGATSLSSMDVISSPTGDIGHAPFRLEVNAELIIYGATEPGATLQVGDRILPVERDGTFRLRYTLPNGAHDLSLKATAARTGEEGWAELRFARDTRTSEHVGAAPQEPGLRPVSSESL